MFLKIIMSECAHIELSHALNSSHNQGEHVFIFLYSLNLMFVPITSNSFNVYRGPHPSVYYGTYLSTEQRMLRDPQGGWVIWLNILFNKVPVDHQWTVSGFSWLSVNHSWISGIVLQIGQMELKFYFCPLDAHGWFRWDPCRQLMVHWQWTLATATQLMIFLPNASHVSTDTQ